MFTLVGSGHKDFSQTYQSMGKSLPSGANWIKDSVAKVDPKKNLVTTAGGLEVSLVILD